MVAFVLVGRSTQMSFKYRIAQPVGPKTALSATTFRWKPSTRIPRLVSSPSVGRFAPREGSRPPCKRVSMLLLVSLVLLAIAGLVFNWPGLSSPALCVVWIWGWLKFKTKKGPVCVCRSHDITRELGGHWRPILKIFSYIYILLLVAII